MTWPLKAEDSVHVSGDPGLMILAVRKDTAAALAGTDGDYHPLLVDSSGKLHVVGTFSVGSLAAGDNNIGNVDIASAIPAGTNNIGDVDIASALPAGTNNIGDVDVASIAAGSNTIGATRDAGPSWTSAFGVSGAVVTSADATTPAAVTDAPTSGQKIVVTDIIASSDTEMFLEFEEETSGTVFLKVFLPANGSVQITPRGKLKLATADKKLMVDAESAGNIAVTVFYYSEA